MDEEERAGQEGALFKQCNIFSWYSNLDHRHLLKIGIDVFLKLMFLNLPPPAPPRGICMPHYFWNHSLKLFERRGRGMNE